MQGMDGVNSPTHTQEDCVENSLGTLKLLAHNKWHYVIAWIKVFTSRVDMASRRALLIVCQAEAWTCDLFLVSY